MSYSPFADAKFMTGLLDAVVSLVLYFSARYVPAHAEEIKFAIGAIQPVFVMLIVGFLQRDQAQIRAGQPLRFLK